MDVASIAGILLGLVVLAACAAPARGGLHAFLDIPSLAIVVGGTLASALIAVPFGAAIDSVRACVRAIFNKQPDCARLIAQLAALAAVARRDGLLSLEGHISDISDPFLADGLQMAVDGCRAEMVEETMRVEMEAASLRRKSGRSAIELMGRAAPAFGMIGTLAGLVVMLGSINSPDAIAPGMAIALMTTLYGLVIANLFCLPFAEKLNYIGKRELLVMEIVIRGVVGIQTGENPRVLVQKLNALLPRDRRAKDLPLAEIIPMIEPKHQVFPAPESELADRKAA
jgi:chemotaxis protein MotA